MKQHRFDPISFFFGLVFTAAALTVLFVDDLDVLDARWVWPVVLIVGGVAMLASMFTQRTPKPDSSLGAPDEPDELLDEAAAELPEPPYR